MFSHTPHPQASSPPEHVIDWFLSGKRPPRTRLHKRPARYLRKKYGPSETNLVADTWTAVGTDNKRLWTLKQLVQEANSALDALATKDDEEFERVAKNDAFYASRSELQGELLLGPYVLSKDAFMNCERIDLTYGLPHMAFLGLNVGKNRKPSKEIEDPENEKANYLLLLAVRMLRLPAFYITPPNTIAVYDVSWLSVFKRNNNTMGFRRYAVITEDGAAHWASRIQRNAWTTFPRKRASGYVSVPMGPVLVTDNLTDDNGDDMIWEIPGLISGYQQIDMNWVVRCSDKRGVVNMSITLNEAKSIFRHRVTAMAKDGKRKRIIHWVRAHNRFTGAHVKTHLRGEREFSIEGLDIEIMLPGKHGDAFTTFTPISDDRAIIEIPALIERSGLGHWYAQWKGHRLPKARTAEFVNPYTGETITINCQDANTKRLSASLPNQSAAI